MKKISIIFFILIIFTLLNIYSQSISTIYLNEKGQLNAISIFCLPKYKGKIYISNNGKIILINLSTPDINLSIDSKGKIFYYSIKNFSNVEFNYLSNLIKKVRYLEFKYDYNNRIKSIGYLNFKYNNFSHITQISNLIIEYDNLQRVKRIGYVNFIYDINRLKQIGNIYLRYDNFNNRIKYINYLSILYKKNKFYKLMGPLNEKINIVIENLDYDIDIYKYSLINSN